jgi:hypothetical protein
VPFCKVQKNSSQFFFFNSLFMPNNKVRSSLAECIIKRIQTEQIAPTPKLYFQLRNAIFWTVFWLCLAFGVLATTMIIYSVNELGFDLLPHSALQYWFRILPVYWVGFFLVFTAIAMLGFQKTKQGYKISFLSLMLCNFGASLFLGSNIYFWGGGDVLDFAVESIVDTYQSMEQRKIILWDRPRQGVLAGTIIAVRDERFWIRSFRNQIWELSLPENSQVPVIGLSVRVTGKIIDSTLFDVETLSYWQVDPWQRVRFDLDRKHRYKPYFIQSAQETPMTSPRLLQKFIQQD